MKKWICLLLALVLLLGLCACGSKAESKAAPASVPAETQVPATSAPTPNPEPVAPEPTEEVPAGKPERNGFNEETNIPYTFSGVTYQLPSYLILDSSNKKSDQVQFGEKNSDGEACMGLLISSSPAEQKKFDENKEQLLNEMAMKVTLQNKVVTPIEEISANGFSGSSLRVDGEDSGEPASVDFSIFFVPELSQVQLLILMQTGSSEYSYDEDFRQIMASAAVAETSEKGPAEAAAAGIRPEVKAAIDAYEAFIDEYCTFMEKANYSDLNWLVNYASYMEKLTTMQDSFDALDDSDLSDEEASYYLEVLSRCSAKLLQAAGSALSD